MPFAVQATALSRSFGDLVAVHEINLDIEDGELFALLGPNGAGKTTTINMLCCLLQPTSGTATVAGHDIRRDPLAVKQAIDISPQETAIAEHLTAQENLRLMAGLHGIDHATTEKRSLDLLDMIGLLERADERVSHYSGGMKRRLSLAMALVTDPEVLFLDEPTLGLDPQSRRVIWGHIEQLKGRTTILLTTHYLEEADALADRIAVIDEGAVIAQGTAAQLKQAATGESLTIVEAADIDDDDIAALRTDFPSTSRTDTGVTIAEDDATLYAIVDCLRPRGVTVESVHRPRVTLDEVFLQLTGKELRP